MLRGVLCWCWEGFMAMFICVYLLVCWLTKMCFRTVIVSMLMFLYVYWIWAKWFLYDSFICVFVIFLCLEPQQPIACKRVINRIWTIHWPPLSWVPEDLAESGVLADTPMWTRWYLWTNHIHLGSPLQPTYYFLNTYYFPIVSKFQFLSLIFIFLLLTLFLALYLSYC